MADLSFERDIKTLFRDRDVRAMKNWFDLESHDDVSAHADGILSRLEAGDMPCDGAWPDTQIGTFRRWIEAGKPA